ncbi:MAG: hypothetical protein AB7V13_14350 [Pseudorhodoplanes sp.]|uniref:hypothetical protein n=1 Tax=Pseudorhodoplanes sp. TaxID=1934341 RepID=UPI003D1506B3
MERKHPGQSDTAMERSQEPPQAAGFAPEEITSAELVKLIRKLRWIGLEEEARQLQIALNRFPPDQRAVLPSIPAECD